MNRHLHAERQTVAQPVDIAGIGLHTGEHAHLRLHPYQGGLMVRKGTSAFPARWDYVRDTHRAVVLGNHDFTLGTVEHLLAAFWGLGITDCLIEVLQGCEVPILDGSALPFMEMIEGAGGVIGLVGEDADATMEDKAPAEPKQVVGETPTLRMEGEAPVAPTKPSPLWGEGTGEGETAQQSLALRKRGGLVPVLEPVWVQQDERVVGVLPGNLYAFGYIQFPEPLGEQGGYFDLRQFREQLAPARTFGFLHEVDSLRQQGLAQGGSLENALLIGPDGYYNKARFEDEPLRHKILDVIGDLMLCGAHLSDFVLVAVKPGHSLDVQLAQAIAQRLPKWQASMEEQHG